MAQRCCQNSNYLFSTLLVAAMVPMLVMTNMPDTPESKFVRVVCFFAFMLALINLLLNCYGSFRKAKEGRRNAFQDKLINLGGTEFRNRRGRQSSSAPASYTGKYSKDENAFMEGSFGSFGSFQSCPIMETSEENEDSDEQDGEVTRCLSEPKVSKAPESFETNISPDQPQELQEDPDMVIVEKAHSRKENADSKEIPIWAKIPQLHQNAVMPREARLSQYMWLHELLRKIAVGEVDDFQAVDNMKGECTTPFMAVVGTCPSRFPPAPMQALLFSVNQSGSTEFWWVKPIGSDISPDTISRNMSGRWKNNAERGTQTYQPIVELFQKKTTMNKGLRFGIDENNRGFIEEGRSDGHVWRNLIYLFYVEEWSAVTKKIKGRILYQRVCVDDTENQSATLCSRPYLIKGDDFTFGKPEEEKEIPALLW